MHTYSGHIGEALAWPTLEVFLTRFRGEVRRERDPPQASSCWPRASGPRGVESARRGMPEALLHRAILAE